MSALLIALAALCSVGLTADAIVGYGIPKDERAVGDLLGRIAKSLVKRHPIRPIGTSVSMPGGDVRLLGLEFQILGPLTKEQLRAAIIDCAHVFLPQVNADEKVRPSLNHYPFSIEDIKIRFFVIDPTGRSVDAPHIRVVRLSEGNLIYRILQDGENGMLISEEEIIESYAEALEAMKREQEGPDQ